MPLNKFHPLITNQSSVLSEILVFQLLLSELPTLTSFHSPEQQAANGQGRIEIQAQGHWTRWFDTLLLPEQPFSLTPICFQVFCPQMLEFSSHHYFAGTPQRHLGQLVSVCLFLGPFPDNKA